MPGKTGTCGFCGTGDGYLGDQGDESTQYLHSSVRSGEPGKWEFAPHPNSLPASHDKTKLGQSIIWCGRCLGGLKHKFQRHDDHNLSSEHLALKFWLELDGPRWGAWDASTPEIKDVVRKYQDDSSIHMQKLGRERMVSDIQNELFRRAGFDLTSRGWRE